MDEKNSAPDSIQRRFKEAAEKGGVGNLLKTADKELHEWKKMPFQIGITGCTGSGKSSLVNALRDLNAYDEEAAPVDVKECTMKPKKYPHPKNPNHGIWDLPGIGTRNFPKKTYLKQVELNRYDFFIIVTSNRFTENDIYLVKELSRMQKTFYCIRSKVGLDVSNSKRTHPSKSEDSVVRSIREDCEKNLKFAGVQTPDVLLVDCFERNKYDFGKLHEKIIDSVDEQRATAFVSTFEKNGMEYLETQKFKLLNNVNNVSWWYFFKRMIPLVDPLTVPLDAIADCCKRFHIDEKSRAEVEEIFKKRAIECPQQSSQSTNEGNALKKKLENKLTYQIWIFRFCRDCVPALKEIFNELHNEAKINVHDTANGFSKAVENLD